MAPVFDWDNWIHREAARGLAQWRIDDSMRTTLNLQTDSALPPARTGFFLTYINSFNEWHEGTVFEPMKNRAALAPEERPYGYHNTADGGYRLEYPEVEAAADSRMSGGRHRLYTTPPFITNFTRSSSVMSASGSPFTAIRSAKRPA